MPSPQTTLTVLLATSALAAAVPHPQPNSVGVAPTTHETPSVEPYVVPANFDVVAAAAAASSPDATEAVTATDSIVRDAALAAESPTGPKALKKRLWGSKCAKGDPSNWCNSGCTTM